MKNGEPHIEDALKLPSLQLDLQLSPWKFFTLLSHLFIKKDKLQKVVLPSLNMSVPS
jgi:hypothetical protein